MQKGRERIRLGGPPLASNAGECTFNFGDDAGGGQGFSLFWGRSKGRRCEPRKKKKEVRRGALRSGEERPEKQPFQPSLETKKAISVTQASGQRARL